MANVSTIEDIISRWAPPSENATQNYISVVCSLTKFKRDYIPKSVGDVALILAAMHVVEQGVPSKKRAAFMISAAERIESYINHFNLRFYEDSI